MCVHTYVFKYCQPKTVAVSTLSMHLEQQAIVLVCVYAMYYHVYPLHNVSLISRFGLKNDMYKGRPIVATISGPGGPFIGRTSFDVTVY